MGCWVEVGEPTLGGALARHRTVAERVLLGPSAEGAGVPMAAGSGVEQEPDDFAGVRAHEL